jgi:hypothetical protein
MVLAAAVLWLRDRSRDRRRVPESKRSASERRNAVGAQTLIAALLLIAIVYRTYLADSLGGRIAYGLLSLIAAFYFWSGWKANRSINERGDN